MKRLIVAIGAALALAALPACGGGSTASRAVRRTILADYNHDQFATSMLGFFPLRQPVKAHPGDTIAFKQAWTGEPHTVTFGTRIRALGDAAKPYLMGTKQLPADGEPKDVAAAQGSAPDFFNESEHPEAGQLLNQTAAQPCFLATGDFPSGTAACPKRSQPAFTGREVLYNSGFIPYQGNNGNRFEMKIADDAVLGEQYFMCLVHGPGMAGYLDIVPKSTPASAQPDINRAARGELDKTLKQFAITDKKAKAGKDKPAGADIQVGAVYDGTTFGFVDEFYPRTFTAKVGQKVTWSLDYHTVSFDVPKYGPQVIVEKDGTVKLNPKAYEPQGGPGYPKDVQNPGEGGAGGGQAATPVQAVDAGNYDGSHFLSSGVPDGSMLYSITFTKPGTYKYACLIHPAMIGTLVVK